MSACSFNSAGGRLRNDPRDTGGAHRHVVELERLQLHRLQIGARKHLVGGDVHFFEVARPHEALDQRDVGRVRGIQRKARRMDLPQAGVVLRRVPEHRRVRLQEDVDRRHAVRLGLVRCVILPGQAIRADGEHHCEACDDFQHGITSYVGK
jgi:hypothetical protein